MAVFQVWDGASVKQVLVKIMKKKTRIRFGDWLNFRGLNNKNWDFVRDGKVKVKSMTMQVGLRVCIKLS